MTVDEREKFKTDWDPLIRFYCDGKKREKVRTDWDALIRMYCDGEKGRRDHMDSVDCEAVRNAKIGEIAYTQGVDQMEGSCLPITSTCRVRFLTSPI